MSIDTIIDETIGREGGYSDHPSDRGGPTRWGITQVVARANGYAGEMRALPRDTAVAIYRKHYFEGPGFEAVAAVSIALAEELFDTGVNMGPEVASRFLQIVLNAMNGQGRLWPEIAEDGDIGAATINALKNYYRIRGARSRAEAELVMLRALNALQAARYIDLSRAREKNEGFVYGWLRTRVA